MNPMAMQIITIILSAAAALIGSLVLWNLNTLKDRVTAVEIEQRRISNHKTECQREFVTAEQFVRSEAYTRQKLDDIVSSLSQIVGNQKVIEQLPVICGKIAADVVKEMRGERYE